MTDVAGAPCPGERLLSSGPIFGRDAMLAAGAVGSRMEINCDIAEAFDISQAKPGGRLTLPSEPSRLPNCRSPSPAGSIRPDRDNGIWVSPPLPASEPSFAKSIPATDPIPDPGDLPTG